MGNLSIILALAAILAGGVVVANLQTNTRSTQAAMHEYQFHVLAREASLAGLQVAVRDLTRHAVTAGSFNGAPNFPRVDVPHDGGFYTVEVFVDQCSALTTADYQQVVNDFSLTAGNFVEVVSTGSYLTDGWQDESQEHETRACYIRSVTSTGTPPGFEFAFISDETFDFNGGPDIISVEVDGEGNVHSNSNMDLGPQVNIEGHATYVDPNGSNAHKNTDVYSFSQGETVPLVEFDPEVYRPEGAHTYMTGSYSVSGTQTVGSTAYTADNPFIWFVDGNFSMSGNTHLILPGYTIIVVTGTLSISGTADITGIAELPPRKGSESEMRDWIYENLTEEGKNRIAVYVNGDAWVGGTGHVIGNFYTKGDSTPNGGGSATNLVAAVQAMGNITANRGGNGNNFWYTGAAESVIIPGVTIPGSNEI